MAAPIVTPVGISPKIIPTIVPPTIGLDKASEKATPNGCGFSTLPSQHEIPIKMACITVISINYSPFNNPFFTDSQLNPSSSGINLKCIFIPFAVNLSQY